MKVTKGMCNSLKYITESNTLDELIKQLKMFYWEVDIKGDYDTSHEISIVRLDNEHGFKSFGWEDERKIIILNSSCRLCDYDHWIKLIKSAFMLRDFLNNLSNIDNKKEIIDIQNKINIKSNNKEKYEFLQIKQYKDLNLIE